MGLEVSLGRSNQFVRHLNAVRLGYGLNTCESLGIFESGCSMMDDYEVIFADYNENTIEFTAAVLSEDGTFATAQVLIEQLGTARDIFFDNQPVSGISS